ncbi:PAS domain-containing sensor histidine kinase [Aurantimonas sp. HBX-1]|uniref:sensor histidine kinase n=1 Tax=Aurantimonas sp. HBX-1 TaxID=2906072 RepID=UPI001F2C5875|nr:PAS domain-containing sensor histidine kinase [Aurantimonas sp. HBX-1]UIJ71305.1 PAS domain S-box protein [Aurantimonas sp. HBX-1]
MATSTVPLALAIMAHRQTRQANASGAGIAVFTPDLSELLWTNSLGAAFLQVDAPGPRLASAPPPASAAVRQLRASARMFAAGATTARLRSPGGALLDASLARIDLDPHGAFALVIVPALAAEAETPAATARRLLAEAGMPLAEIRLRDGTRFAGEDSPQVAIDDATIAAFLASDETVRVDEGGSLVLARLTDNHVLLHEAERPPASVAPEADESASPADMPDAATPVSEPAGPDRRKTGMSALLTRWYARHPASESPVEAANQSAPQAAADATDGTAAPAIDADPEKPEAVAMPDMAPGQDDAATASDDQPTTGAWEPPSPTRLRPLRSAWGPAVTLATPDEPSATDVPEPDDALPTASVAADAAPESSADGEPGPGEAAFADEAVAAEPDRETETDGDEQPVAADAGDLEPALPEAAAEEEADEADAPEPRSQGPSAPFEPRFDIAAVRFVWRIDSDGRFRSLSPEFAAAVGPHSADVIDRSFADVARAYGLDPDGEVGQLLERRDTWSGRVIHWPVESSDRKAPVDLAALPVYARDRSFDGFRGFGVVRLAESVADPERLGLALAGVTPPDEAAEADRPEPAGDMAVPLQDGSVSFGRRPAAERRREGETVPKVIRLEERRRPRDGALSQSEEEAFRRIGQTLSDEETPHGLEQAVRLAAQRIEAFEDEDAEAQTPAEAPARDEATAESSADEPEAGGTPEAERAPETAPAASASDEGLVQALATVYAHLPLPVLVQVRETLAYGNREFLDLTGYADVEALEAEGGLAHLFADRDDQSAVAGELTIRRATGETIAVRTHMQRTTIAGRSCLVMSFFASPGASVAAMRGDAVREASTGDDAEVKRLRHEVEELSTVLDTATDGVVFIDSAGNIRSMNGSAHALFGIGEDDSAGRPFVTLFAHESQKATMEYLESLREGGASAIVNEGREVIGRVAQGGFIPLSITLGPLPDDRGWCAVIRDIAHWKRVEEELTSARRQAEAASVQKSQFLTNVSHELRTPLNAIIGFADVMATECFGPIGNDRYLEYLEDIKRSGHHVLDLVNDLLDISKIEAGKLDLSFEAVSLNAVMAEVVALMQPQANRERVLVRSNLPSSVPPVVADHRSIRQIAMNLVSNAIRFTPPGGQIIVSTSYVAEGDVALRFRDSGIGMTEHEIEIAMLPFQQVNPTSRRRGEGTGLGLPLTKAMAEANRANFSISSTPGEGTLVEILFPRQRVLAS